jgi:hypothetical protein
MKKHLAVVLLWAGAATQLAACGADTASEGDKARIQGKSTAACLNKADRRARYIDNDDELFADEVHIATLSNKATVRLFDSSESATENYELIEDEFVEEPSRFVLSNNAILTWDETPSEEDEDAVTKCLRVA